MNLVHLNYWFTRCLTIIKKLLSENCKICLEKIEKFLDLTRKRSRPKKNCLDIKPDVLDYCKVSSIQKSSLFLTAKERFE